MTTIDKGTILYRDELLRKLIHLCSLSIPIIYYFSTRNFALIILSILTSIFLIIDLIRFYLPSFAKLFYSIFGLLLREHELDENKKNLTGATYVLLAATISVFLFPKIIVLTSFSILIISDTVAALIGRKFGKHKFLRKSLEGTLSFFLSAIIVVMISPKINGLYTEYLIGIIAAGIGAIVENVSYGWLDDNLSIPISIGLVMWLLYIVMLPNLTLILPNTLR